MATMHKTTVYLDPELQLELREASAAQSRSQAEVIRDAIRSHLRSAKRPPIKGIGAYRSGRSDISEKVEEILAEASKSRRWR